MATVKILVDVFARGERVLKKDDVRELDGAELARALRRQWGMVVDPPAVTEHAKAKRKG